MYETVNAVIPSIFVENRRESIIINCVRSSLHVHVQILQLTFTLSQKTCIVVLEMSCHLAVNVYLHRKGIQHVTVFALVWNRNQPL